MLPKRTLKKETTIRRVGASGLKLKSNVNKSSTASLVAPAGVDLLRLPSVKSKPSISLFDYSILIIGEKKIGKTTMLQHCPETLFLMFEPGARALSVYKIEVATWEQFLQALKLLQKDKRFKTVVLDTVDIAYKLCFDYMCRKMVIDHPHDENDYGKSWGKIEKEFASSMKTLLELDKGIVFIGHSQEKEVQTRKGDKFDKVVPTMAKQAASFLEGVVDIWCYYGYDEKRLLYIQGDDYISAGTRCEKNFLDVKTGEPLRAIPMGRSSSEAYRNLNRAFNNELSNAPVASKKSLIKPITKTKTLLRRKTV